MLFFAIFDKKAASFKQPQFFPHVAEALRAVERAANDPNHFLGEHPSDYDLYEVGRFDAQLGEFLDYGTKCICSVASLVKVANGGVA